MNPFPSGAACLTCFLCGNDLVVISLAEEVLVYCQGQQAGPLVPDHGRGGAEKWVVISLDGTSFQEEREREMYVVLV